MILPSRLRQHASAAGWCTCAIALILMMLMSGTPSAQAQDDAGKVLKAMTNYVTSQKVISATYDTDIEIVTDNLQTPRSFIVLSRGARL